MFPKQPTATREKEPLKRRGKNQSPTLLWDSQVFPLPLHKANPSRQEPGEKGEGRRKSLKEKKEKRRKATPKLSSLSASAKSATGEKENLITRKKKRRGIKGAAASLLHSAT